MNGVKKGILRSDRHVSRRLQGTQLSTRICKGLISGDLDTEGSRKQRVEGQAEERKALEKGNRSFEPEVEAVLPACQGHVIDNVSSRHPETHLRLWGD